MKKRVHDIKGKFEQLKLNNKNRSEDVIEADILNNYVKKNEEHYKEFLKLRELAKQESDTGSIKFKKETKKNLSKKLTELSQLSNAKKQQNNLTETYNNNIEEVAVITPSFEDTAITIKGLNSEAACKSLIRLKSAETNYNNIGVNGGSSGINTYRVSNKVKFRYYFLRIR